MNTSGQQRVTVAATLARSPDAPWGCETGRSCGRAHVGCHPPMGIDWAPPPQPPRPAAPAPISVSSGARSWLRIARADCSRGATVADARRLCRAIVRSAKLGLPRPGLSSGRGGDSGSALNYFQLEQIVPVKFFKIMSVSVLEAGFLWRRGRGPRHRSGSTVHLQERLVADGTRHVMS